MPNKNIYLKIINELLDYLEEEHLGMREAVLEQLMLNGDYETILEELHNVLE